MSVPPEHIQAFSQFPEALRQLVAAELAARNTIAELGHGFPAAPCGAYIKLARPVTSRRRETTSDLDFYDRNGSSYAGEFTDAQRHFFVLEPPHRAEPEPNMDAIRAKRQAAYAAANSITHASPTPLGEPAQASPAAQEIRAHVAARSDSIVGRFIASMTIDYKKWHDGIGYDLGLFKQATPEELVTLEKLLVQRPCSGWREVEALAALGTKRAKDALNQAHVTGNAEVRMAVHSFAPELLTDGQRVAALVQTLEQADFYDGLSRALDEVAKFHPPEIVTALLRGLMERDGAAACHFAAMLYFIHGKAASAFDWDQRPFFLRFNTDNLVEREVAVRELCQELGIDPHRCIKPKRA
jgi:hypothetical protein